MATQNDTHHLIKEAKPSHGDGHCKDYTASDKGTGALPIVPGVSVLKVTGSVSVTGSRSMPGTSSVTGLRSVTASRSVTST